MFICVNLWPKKSGGRWLNFSTLPGFFMELRWLKSRYLKFMKKNTLLAAGAALVLAVCANTTFAQDAPAPNPVPSPAPAPAPAPMPPGRRPMGPMTGRPLRMSVPMAVRSLQDVKRGLQAAQDDVGGHKQSAIDACDKALEELQEVMKVLPAPQPPPQRPGAAFPGAAVPPGGTPPGTPPPAAPQTPPPAGTPQPPAPPQK